MHSTANPSADILPSSEIRKLVARGFSAMYGAELPEYNRFTVPVKASNLARLARHPDPHVNRDTLMEKKHSAIRMPGPTEMRIVTRIFAVMGMFPVEFYDMTVLGTRSLPMIATAFRSTDGSIEDNAFRMFCSMLHVDSIPPPLKEEVLAELEKNRRLCPKFSPDLLAMLDQAEASRGIGAAEARRFTALVVDAFSMHKEKVVDFTLYSRLRKMNQIARIAAGEEVFVARQVSVLAAFEANPGSLSDMKANAPRVELQQGENVADYMARIGKTLEETPMVIIHHKARFGEIESRGVALTVEGEAAYRLRQPDVPDTGGTG